MVQAVLVGCGAMSKAWLEAARQIDGVDHRRARRSRPRARRGAGAGVRPRRRRDRHRPRRVLEQTRPDVVSTSSFPRRGATWRSTAFAHGCHVLTEKPMADSREHARAIVDAARRAEPASTPSCRTAATSPTSGASGASSSPARSASRPASTATSSSRRISAASARRWSTSCCSTWRSTPSTRRASWSDGEPLAVYCHEWEPEELLVRGRARRRSRSSRWADGVVFTYRGCWCADGLRTSWESALADRRRARHADLGRLRRPSRRSDDDGARRALRQGRADRGAAARSARPRRRPSRRHAGFRRRDRERRPSPRRAATDNIKSLAMVFGAIESAETGRRVAISDLTEQRVTEPAQGHPHRHHGQGNVAGPGRLRPADLPTRLRELRAVLLADASAARTLPRLAKRVRDAIGNRDIIISTLGMFGNPLEDSEIDRADAAGLEDADRQRASSSAPTLRRRLHRPRPRQAADRQPAALQGSLGRARQARRRQGRQDRLRELRHGRQLGDRRLEHRAQSRRLGADLQRDARRQYRARMGALPPARLPDRSAAADPQMGAEDSSTSTARTRRCAGT